MGGGASQEAELTAEEKAQISGKIQKHYEELKNGGASQSTDDITLFNSLKNAYEEERNVIVQSKSSAHLKIETNPENELDVNAAEDTTVEPLVSPAEVEGAESASKAKRGKPSNRHGHTTKKHIGYSFDNEDLPEYHEFGVMVEAGDLDGTSFKMSSEMNMKSFGNNSPLGPSLGIKPPIMARTKTSSQLLSEAADAALDDQSKINSFLSSLKAGEVASSTSEFRKRRLTFEQQIELDKKESTTPGASLKASRTAKGRTSIFASSEIGVVQEKKPPFSGENLGTYSCHGIEPDMNSDSGIHEKINQDRGCVVYPYNGLQNEALFCVMDGHGEHGDKVSEFVMRQVVVSLEKDPKLPDDPPTALKNAFVTTNTALLVTQIHYMTSGTTCVVVYVKGKTLFVANAGDSRAVMAFGDKGEGAQLTARDMSRDHKPDDPEEMDRITKWGGFVMPAPEEGLSARVYLDPEFTMIGLAMSRSIGDHAVKAVGVIPEPEVKDFELQDDDQFMIMASDGVWEFITSQEAVDIVQANMHRGCAEACQELIETAALRWQEEEGDYRDDITAIVVKFPLPFQQ